MDDAGSISADVSALRARVDELEHKVEFLLKHLGLAFDRDVRTNVEADVADALRAGDTIEAIKIYREATHTGLKEAKDAVEEMARDLGLS